MNKTLILFILLLVSCSKPDDIEIVSEPLFINMGMNESGILVYEIINFNHIKMATIRHLEEVKIMEKAGLLSLK